MSYSAAILADSIANGVRLTTFLVVYPRWMHPEVLRTRMHSHSVGSSRAIPTERMIERTVSDPFVPDTFNKRVKGMGVGEAFSERDQDDARRVWLAASQSAARHAHHLNEQGVDKSRANRLLEPFLWLSDIITGTEWANFFALRCPPGNEPDINFPAQLEFQQLAILMREELRNSQPVKLRINEWHRPYVDVNVDGDEIYKTFIHEDDDFYTHRLNLLSARRIAKISFERHEENEDLRISLDKAGNLVSMGHFSPTEHVARPISAADVMDEKRSEKLMAPVSLIRRYANGENPSTVGTTLDQIWCGNLRGYWQFRKEFEGEDDHSRLLDYEVM